MTTTTIGKVRLLDPGTPGLPLRSPDMDHWCDARIERADLPGMVHDQYTVAYLCTRYPHPANEVHVSQPCEVNLSRSVDPRIIVWGGE